MKHSNTCNKQQIETLRLLKRNIIRNCATVDRNADQKNT
jgi:hypothetical protein